MRYGLLAYRLCLPWLPGACLVLLVGCGPGEEGGAAEGGRPVPEAVGGTVFTDVTEAAGLGTFRHVTGAVGDKWFPETMGGGVGFVDYDGDGWIDVLLVGGGTWSGAGPVPALAAYRNNGDGTFTDQTEAAGLAGIAAYGFGLSAADYDNDGDPDVFLTTLAENKLFRNDGGVFTEVGRAAGLGDTPRWSTSALFFDADRDGHIDLYVGNYVVWSPDKDLLCTAIGTQIRSYCTPTLYEGLAGQFYRNEGDGTFVERTEEAGFGSVPGKTLAVAEADFNRDGWSDLVVANDTQRDLFFENRGDGTFREIGMLSGMAFDENGRARAGMGIDVGIVDDTGQPTIFVGNFSKEMVGVYRYAGDGLFIDRAAVSRVGLPSLQTLTFGLFLFDVDLDRDLDLFLANGHITEEIGRVEEGITFRQPAQLFRNRGDGLFDVVLPEAGPLTEPMVARGAAYGDYDRDGDLDVLINENGGPVHLWRNDLAEASWLRVRLEGKRSNRDALGARVVAVFGGRRSERRVRTGASYLSQSEQAITFGLGAAGRVDSLMVYWPAGGVDRFADVPANQALRIVEGAGIAGR